MIANKNITISKNIIITIFTFFILISFFRLLLPYGDEPDFLYRINKLLFDEHSVFSPYYYFQDLLNGFNWTSNEGLIEKIIRIVLTIFLVLPLLMILIFKNFFKNIVLLMNNKLSTIDWENKIKALSLSLLFPSILYSLGVFAEEQFTLILSLFIFLFFDYLFLIIILSFWIAFIDFGNSIVVLLFIILFYYNKIIYKLFSLKVVMIHSIIFITIAFFVGLNLVYYLSSLPIIGAKASLIYEHYTTIYAYVTDKYPTIVRPIITLITGIFWLPSNFLALYLYPIYFISLFLIVKKSIVFNVTNYNKNSYNQVKSFLSFLSALTVIFFMPLVLNGFSNAKYYVFLIPFILQEALKYFKYSSIFYFLLTSNIFILLHLFIKII